MKVYTKVVIDMATMETEYEESYEYEGDVALCKSGDSTTKVKGEIDKEYNKRMATIAESQQEMAEEMMGYYRQHGLPLDKAMTKAGLDLLPHQTKLEIGRLESGLESLPYQTELEIGSLEAGLELLPEQTKLTMDQIKSQRRLLLQQEKAKSQFFHDAQGGIDIRGRMGMAQADVAKGFQGALGQQRLADSRMGLNPASGASMSRAQDLAINQAGAMAGARTQARVGAEQEQFGRRQAAAGLGLGV